ncbi:hypothetical protein EDB19DRAFT_1916663 [Suillus lakei]|nr:hypothetical protein EDB19DRAFT_1916663 [Suillus lakei]
MAEWADVYKDTESKDPSRNRILIYKNVPNMAPDTVFPVAIRLQGLLRQFRVDRFGNWTGRDTDVHRAVQHATLSSGGNKKAWDTTVTSINLACEYVSRRLHVPMQGIANDKDLYLQRRAFIKTNREKQKRLSLSRLEDPEGSFSRVQQLWNAQRPLRVAEMTGVGEDHTDEFSTPNRR